MSAAKMHWRLKLTAARQSSSFSEMQGALHNSTSHSTIDACMQTVYKWFRTSNGHLTFQIWTPCKYQVWEAMQTAFWKLYLKPKKFLIKKSHWRRHWEFFRRIKLSWGLERKEYVKAGGRHFEHLLSLKKVFPVTVFVLSWTLLVWDNFW